MIQRIEKIKNFLPSKQKIADNLEMYLEVVYMRFPFVSKEMFSVWFLVHPLWLFI